MSGTNTAPRLTGRPTSAGRLLAAEGPGLAAHLDCYGARPRGSAALVGEVERSGLRGRGGAGFPMAVKLASVTGRRRVVVVANGTEGEPLSAKDKTLMMTAPHLVIDGVAIAAETVGATEALICAERGVPGVISALEAALAERRPVLVDDVDIRVTGTPSRFVAGEETALVHWLNGGDAKPTMAPPRPFERGVGGRPTLVQNVETLAHLALIARYGAAWFRRVGACEDPGTRLVTISGGVAAPGVFEVASGAPLRDVLVAAGGAAGPPPPVLVGGYFGTWLDPDAVAAARLDVASMRAFGASPGCGVIWALPPRVCGLAESAVVARWYADQSAGQCGPCANGLPAIADAMAAIVAGRHSSSALAAVERWSSMVTGRGACRHPDGSARFVSSALRTFASEIERHGRSGPCEACRQAPQLPVPKGGGWR